jgi:hypothetical protein
LGGLELRDAEGKINKLHWPLCEGHMRLASLLAIERVVRGRADRGEGLPGDRDSLNWVARELSTLRELLSRGVSVDITGKPYIDQVRGI